MGRRARARVNVSKILVLDEERNIIRYYNVDQPSKKIVLPKPMTTDEFHQYLNQAEPNNKIVQEPQDMKQSTTSLPNGANKSPSLVVHREYGFTNPEFERGPSNNSNNRFCYFDDDDDDDDEENDIFVFNTELLMKGQSMLAGTISTYDPTALYSKDHE